MTLRHAALELRDLTVAYRDAPVVEGVSARFEAGAMTAIVGPNGAGKSSLLKGALGLIPRLSGEVSVYGQPLAAARRRFAYVPQRSSIDWEFPARVMDVVRMGLYPEIGLMGRLSGALKARAAAALERVGLSDLAWRQIGQLSGGQQQRVFLARALAQGADLYLLDEPFAGVDAATETAILSVLHGLRDEGRSIVAVHHDLSTVPEAFDRVLILNRRKIAEGTVAEAFTEEALQEAYGGRLPAMPAAALPMPLRPGGGVPAPWLRGAAR